MIRWSLLLFAVAGCGTPAPSDTVSSPAAEPSILDANPADAVIQRHIDATGQCKLLTADNYRMTWSTITTDKKTAAKAETVVQMGRKGTQFARIIEQTQPVPNFRAFGMEAGNKWWSAGDKGIRLNLTEPSWRPLMVFLDPTPVCAFQARWKERTLVGEVDYEGEQTNHVRGTWADGTVTDMWFSTKTGTLTASLTDIGVVTNALRMKNYTDFDGVFWPKEVTSSRTEAGLTLFVVERLDEAKLNLDPFTDIGANEIAAALTGESKKAEPKPENAPEVDAALPQ